MKLSEYYEDKGLKDETLCNFEYGIAKDSLRIFYDHLDASNSSFYMVVKIKKDSVWSDYYREVSYFNYDLTAVIKTYSDFYRNNVWEKDRYYYSSYRQDHDFGDEYVWNGSTWTYDFSYHAIYNDNHTRDSFIYYRSEINNICERSEKYLYDNEKLKECRIYNKDSSNLNLTEKIIYEYDNTGMMITEKYFYKTNEEWINKKRIVYSYNSHGYTSSKLTQSSSGLDWNNETLEECEYYFPLIVKILDIVPNAYKLEQNYPNPFNPSTQIKFYLPMKSYVKLSVYNILGEEIITLVNGELTAGEHETVFNAKNIPSGVYFYKLQTREGTLIKKMLLAK
jgi:hypothetical protein